MADRYDERYRHDQYRDERGHGRPERSFTERASDEVRSWSGDDEAERRHRLDEQERNERDRRREYGRGYEPEWGDYPYRGETWQISEPWGGRGSEPDRHSSTRPGRAYGGAEHALRDYGPDPGEAGTRRYAYGTETYDRPHDRPPARFDREPRGEFAGRGPKGYQRSDARIQEDVCDRLAEAPDVDASDIEVQTSNGEVTLSGSVREREEKRRAEDLIEGVSGVRDIRNNLRVSRPQGQATRTTSGPT
jgi:osmotically-inducible protein OsmY